MSLVGTEQRIANEQLICRKAQSGGMTHGGASTSDYHQKLKDMKVYVTRARISFDSMAQVINECYVHISKTDAMAEARCIVKHYSRGKYKREEFKTPLRGTGSIYRLYLYNDGERIEVEIFERDL